MHAPPAFDSPSRDPCRIDDSQSGSDKEKLLKMLLKKLSPWQVARHFGGTDTVSPVLFYPMVNGEGSWSAGARVAVPFCTSGKPFGLAVTGGSCRMQPSGGRPPDAFSGRSPPKTRRFDRIASPCPTHRSSDFP